MYLSGHKSQLYELDVRIQIQGFRIHWDSEGILSSQVSLLLIVYTLSDICCVRAFTLTQLELIRSSSCVLLLPLRLPVTPLSSLVMKIQSPEKRLVRGCEKFLPALA